VVTETSAVLWARASEPGEVVVSFESGSTRARIETERDFTARVELKGLEPGTLYRYQVRVENGSGSSPVVEGSFRTAPGRDRAGPVRFVVAGDLGGHGYCREEHAGYGVFSRMRELEPHFFVANGDMIYADSECPAERPGGGRNVPGSFPKIDAEGVDWTDAEAVREIYLAHWRYNRADEHFQRFLREVPVYVQWDDHEVINDFGAGRTQWAAEPEREGFPVLVSSGRQALFDFHPLFPAAGERDRIYRSFRWGRDVELFLLDARSYRSPNDAPDSPGEKTLLGKAQLDWLKRGLSSSDATWKIVSSDVPLSIATGTNAQAWGRDAFADGGSGTGSESELRDLLLHLDRENVRNVVFVVTDVHFAATLRYDIDLDLDADSDRLRFHELVSGPLSAGLVDPRTPDDTFGPEVLYAEGGIFNFSFIRVEGAKLTADIRDDGGRVRPGSVFTLTAEE
jgi:alkaline phosphatase D